MGIAGTIASGAGKLGKEAIKSVFSGMFSGDKKRTANKPLSNVKPESGEFGTFGAGIIQNNELLSQSIDIQKEQNIILDKILKLLTDKNKSSSNDILDRNLNTENKNKSKEEPKKAQTEEERKAALKEKAKKIAEEKAKNPEMTSKEAKAKIDAVAEKKAPIVETPHSEAKGAGKVGALVGGGLAAAGGGNAGQIAAGAAEGAVVGAGVAVGEKAIKEAIVKIVGPKLPKIAAAAVPGVGLVTGIGFGIWRAMEGDFKGAAAEVTSGALSAAGGAAAAGTLGIGTPAAVAASAGSVAIQAGLLARDVYQAVYGKLPDDDPESVENLKKVAEAVKDYVYSNVPGLNKDAEKEDKKSDTPSPTGVDSADGGNGNPVKEKIQTGQKETTAQIIEFKAREILFSAKEMTIKTEELKVNGVPTSNGAQVLGVTPSAAGATPQATPTPSAPAGAPPAGATAAEAGGDKAAAGGLTEVKTKSGKSTKVGAAYASNFQGFINDLEATGYKINSIGGYADRANVNNPSVKSFHAMGAAIDINPGSNPNKSTKTDLPPQTGTIAAAHGLGWGMNWKSVKDPMHFSAAKAEQGSFDIKRGSIAAGEVQGGAAPAGGAQPAKADATKTDMSQAPSTTGAGLANYQSSAGVTSNTPTVAPTYTPSNGRQNAPTPAAEQQSNGAITSPGTTPQATPAGASGSALPSVPPIQGETQQELANRIKSVAPHLKNQQCVTLAKAAVGSTDSVTTWRKGANATENELPVGTPVATFMNRQGGASERYDAGGTGSPGTMTTHAATVAGYVKDKDGKITGMQVWEQYTGSGGPRLKTYPAGQGFGEKNASNYHAIEQEGKDGQRVALGTNNPYQQYLEKQREAVAENKPAGETPSAPSNQTAEQENTAPKQVAENLTPATDTPSAPKQTSTPTQSPNPSPRPKGVNNPGLSNPGSLGAPSNELLKAYLTVAA